MKEQLISSETAKLAKEKGFSWEVYDFYYQEKSNFKPYLTRGSEYDSDRDCKWDWNLNGGVSGELLKIIPYPNSNKGYYYSAPTQSLLQKWLREKHKIHIIVYVMENSDGNIYYDFGLKRIVNYLSDNSSKPMEFSTYEEALEVGLQEALKLIK